MSTLIQGAKTNLSLAGGCPCLVCRLVPSVFLELLLMIFYASMKIGGRTTLKDVGARQLLLSVARRALKSQSLVNRLPWPAMRRLQAELPSPLTGSVSSTQNEFSFVSDEKLGSKSSTPTKLLVEKDSLVVNGQNSHQSNVEVI